MDSCVTHGHIHRCVRTCRTCPHRFPYSLMREGSEAMIPQGHSQCLYVEFQYYFLANVTRFPGGCSTFYSRRGNTRWFQVMLMPRSKEVLNTEPKPNPKMRV